MILDLLHLIRSIRRSPASAAAAVLTLALTVGAGASIFAVVDAVLLTPPPFANPDALVVLGETPIDDPGSAPRSDAHQAVQLRRGRGPIDEIEPALVLHRASRIEKARHGRRAGFFKGLKSADGGDIPRQCLRDRPGTATGPAACTCFQMRRPTLSASVTMLSSFIVRTFRLRMMNWPSTMTDSMSEG